MGALQLEADSSSPPHTIFVPLSQIDGRGAT